MVPLRRGGESGDGDGPRAGGFGPPAQAQACVLAGVSNPARTTHPQLNTKAKDTSTRRPAGRTREAVRRLERSAGGRTAGVSISAGIIPLKRRKSARKQPRRRTCAVEAGHDSNVRADQPLGSLLSAKGYSRRRLIPQADRVRPNSNIGVSTPMPQKPLLVSRALPVRG